MAKGVYVGAPNFEPVSLPSGYTQLEYIQSSGTQYINTNFKPDGETTVNIVFQTSSVPNNLNDTLPVYGAATDYNSNAFEFWTLSGGFATYGSQDYKSNLGITTGKKHTISQAKNVLTVDGTSHTFTKQTFTAPYSLLLFATHRSGGIKICASAANLKIYSCEIYNNGTLVRNFIPAKNSGGTIGLYDLVNSAFYTNAGSGTFTAGAIYAEVARKVKKIYLGIDNRARKVKKGYIGVGGVARPFMVTELEYYGRAKALSYQRQLLAATTIGNYALFGGGNRSSESANVVDAYSASLTRSVPTAMTTKRHALAAATIGNYALFGGGQNYSGDDYLSSVETYNTSLTKGSASSFSRARRRLAATSIGNYALFAGGYEKSLNGPSPTQYGDAYNRWLTRSNIILRYGQAALAATSVGSYALFAGGEGDSTSASFLNYVCAFDTSLTKNNNARLSSSRHSLAGASIGNYALFGGGYNGSSMSAVVDAFNSSLTRTIAPSLSTARNELAATAIGDYAIFAGGYASSYSAVVDIYDKSLTKKNGTKISSARYQLAATNIGNYALFGGGCDSRYSSNVVDVYIA